MIGVTTSDGAATVTVPVPLAVAPPSSRTLTWTENDPAEV